MSKFVTNVGLTTFAQKSIEVEVTVKLLKKILVKLPKMFEDKITAGVNGVSLKIDGNVIKIDWFVKVVKKLLK